MCRSITRSLSKIALLKIASLIVCCAATTGTTPPVATSARHIAVAARTYYPEARLRKMHLVRPDLILYPIFYDIYC
jgi:hypothetical protein